MTPRRTVLKRGICSFLTSAGILLSAPLPAMAGPTLNASQRELLQSYVRHGDNFPSRHRWTTLESSSAAMPVKVQGREDIRYSTGSRETSLSEYFDRQPVTALLIWKDGALIYERYQYTGSKSALFYSASMAKSLVGLSIAKLEESGALRSQDIAVGELVPTLAGTPLGNASVRDHMRMGSGIRYSETHRPGDDHDRFNKAVEEGGLRAGFQVVTSQEVPPGSRFQYAGVSSAVLSAVVSAVSGRNAAAYFGQEVWSRLGTESRAYWIEDRAGTTWGYCCFLARARDYLRLGIVLANGGKRPDTGEQVIPASLITRITNPGQLDGPFKPPASGPLAYDSQIWISARTPEAFSFRGQFGQRLHVYPRSALVIVQFGMSGNKGTSDFTRETDAMAAGIHRTLK